MLKHPHRNVFRAEVSCINHVIIMFAFYFRRKWANWIFMSRSRAGDWDEDCTSVARRSTKNTPKLRFPLQSSQIDSRLAINVAIFAFNWINIIIINWNSCYIKHAFNKIFPDLARTQSRRGIAVARYAATLFALVNWNCMFHLQDARIAISSAPHRRLL